MNVPELDEVQIVPLSDLLKNIFAARFDRQRATLVGIDGCGGAGKSTLSRSLEALAEGTTVVEMDNFYKPLSQHPITNDDKIGALFDWCRLRDQVLVPLSVGRNGRYQRYDWNADCLTEWHDVPANGLVLVEGIYTTRAELRDFYDVRIWIDTPTEVRLARGIARDGKSAHEMWTSVWMPAEEAYVASHNSARHAHVIVSRNYPGVITKTHYAEVKSVFE